ncbi:hypothetical protein [Geothrix fermentans]|uniref:hypothetical protein n=1 Tax=Geothrix fermentans TaxID=44676 RepID=UPI0012FC46D0|nr:hypothetical protein [Geothrix fermentans]
MGTQTSTGRTISAKTGWIIIGIVLAAVIGIGAAVAPTSKPVAGKEPSVTAEVEEQRLLTATRMIDEGKLNADGIKRIKTKLESDLDRTNGRQLAAYGGFLWAAYEATAATDTAMRQSYFNEGMEALTGAESRGWTKAFIVDGSWRGQHSWNSTAVFLGESDPRSSTWPILVAVARWQEGANKGDASCRFLMDNLAPAWGTTQGIMREVEALERTFRANEKAGTARELLKADLAAADEAKMKWIINSGLISTHGADHPQHSLPCWAWVVDKSSALVSQWNQAHPQP